MNEIPEPRARAFVSYSNVDRIIGAQVKDVLEYVGIDTFLAHDHLQVSEEWRTRILEELSQCDIFVPLFSRHFLESHCAQQEAGFEAGFIVSRQKWRLPHYRLTELFQRDS
ncbi:MAG: hypothetical protein BZY83_02175 [SAR202 cluster bacterium Casp-Chloro-G2]|nr:MAG: hypothetical protein BZY83_02175 [SAR202 cluster bacterium Casp-Chloro-G2]